MNDTSNKKPTATDWRKRQLAKVHIAKKALALDDETYRGIIKNQGGAATGSAGDLSEEGFKRVLNHFRACGWQAKPGKNIPVSPSLKANDGQLKLVRHIWAAMADAGVINDHSEAALRAWCRSQTRRYHPHRAGYDAPEFMPAKVAQRVIEHLKQWAKRCEVSI